MEAKEEKRRKNDGVRIDVDLRVDGRSQWSLFAMTALMDIHHFFCSDVIIGDMSLLCHCRFY